MSGESQKWWELLGVSKKQQSVSGQWMLVCFNSMDVMSRFMRTVFPGTYKVSYDDFKHTAFPYEDEEVRVTLVEMKLGKKDNDDMIIIRIHLKNKK